MPRGASLSRAAPERDGLLALPRDEGLSAGQPEAADDGRPGKTPTNIIKSQSIKAMIMN